MQKNNDTPEPTHSAPAPGGLLGLLLQPLQTLIAAGLRLFAALVAGILRAFLPPPPPQPPEPRS